jgi:hypothetical protein
MAGERKGGTGSGINELRDKLDALTGRAVDAAEERGAELQRKAAIAAAEAAVTGAWRALKGVVSSEAEDLLSSAERSLAERSGQAEVRATKVEGAAAAARAEREARSRRAADELARLKAARAQGADPAASAPDRAGSPPKKSL